MYRATRAPASPADALEALLSGDDQAFEFACPNGHGIILKGHSIDADDTVHPIVVCPAPACDFHDFIRLSRWDTGPI